MISKCNDVVFRADYNGDIGRLPAGKTAAKMGRLDRNNEIT